MFWSTGAVAEGVSTGLVIPASLNDVGFHREVLRQPEPVEGLSGVLVPGFDALPEFAIVQPGKWRGVFLRLVLEDRLDLDGELFLGERYQPGRFGHRPLLPGPAIEPDLGLRREPFQRPIDRLLAH